MPWLNFHVGGTSHLLGGMRWNCLCIISPKLWLLPEFLREPMAEGFKALKLVLNWQLFHMYIWSDSKFHTTFLIWYFFPYFCQISGVAIVSSSPVSVWRTETLGSGKGKRFATIFNCIQACILNCRHIWERNGSRPSSSFGVWSRQASHFLNCE